MISMISWSVFSKIESCPATTADQSPLNPFHVGWWPINETVNLPPGRTSHTHLHFSYYNHLLTLYLWHLSRHKKYFMVAEDEAGWLLVGRVTTFSPHRARPAKSLLYIYLSISRPQDSEYPCPFGGLFAIFSGPLAVALGRSWRSFRPIIIFKILIECHFLLLHRYKTAAGKLYALRTIRVLHCFAAEYPNPKRKNYAGLDQKTTPS